MVLVQNLILTSEAALLAGQEEVGGKATGLARLDQAGAKVPPWFVIGSGGLFLHTIKSGLGGQPCDGLAGLRGQLRDGLAGLRGQLRDGLARLNALEPGKPENQRVIEEVAKALQSAILERPVPIEVREELESALPTLGAPPFAVRSSMAGEDSARHSFAGQLESFLFQRDLESVAQSVRLCWASAFSARVLAYRLGTGEPLAIPNMGVVVQKMISGQVSGVVFTAHPTTGQREQALITAAWGQGEGIVSGLCNTDEYVYAHSGAELACTIADKDLALTPDPSGRPGTIEIAVEEGRRRERCLDTGQVIRIGAESVRLAGALGSPQDIEWTLDGESLYLLQSRPITSLPAMENRDGPRLVFDNSNIQESYCGVTTPLTFSFASKGYASVYEQTLHALGASEATIMAHRPMLRNMLGLIRGRVYYNINNWYRGLLLLPSFGRNKEDMEQMMGLQDPVDFIEDQVLTLTEKLARLPRMGRTAFRLLGQFRRLKRSVPRFLEDFQKAYNRVDRGRLPEAGFSELMSLLDQIDREILAHWHVPIINDFWVMMAMGRLRRLVEKSGVDEPNALINNLMAGEEGIESTEPTRMLMRMAKEARQNRPLAEALQEGPPLEAIANLKAGYPEFAARLARYIEKYGDRVMGELKLETITLREDPTFAVLVLRNYLDREDLDPAALATREKVLRTEAETALAGGLGLLGRRRMKGVLKAARTAVKNRENMRLARTRMFGLYRDVYNSLGLRLHEAGRLAQPRDIFYLTVEELAAYHEGRAVATDFQALTASRKAEYAAYEAAELPHHFETVGPVYHGNRYEGPRSEAPAFDGSLLKGIGCYPGVVESPVKVILSPRDELSVNGRILVTVRTDPGWAPLFPTTSGILVERGSTLSHSAVVARELGIPAVVGIPNLLAILEDGEQVRMDGGKGTVERLEPLEGEKS